MEVVVDLLGLLGLVVVVVVVGVLVEVVVGLVEDSVLAGSG